MKRCEYETEAAAAALLKDALEAVDRVIEAIEDFESAFGLGDRLTGRIQEKTHLENWVIEKVLDALYEAIDEDEEDEDE